ncbi:MAG: Holliday junction resolvase RuvX [Deltaproteobacteria bacterium]|nr:Holliday junction resolvase RuvX [Deltaproteobacteria bacterium]
MMSQRTSYLLGLDVGDARVGVAIGSRLPRMTQPLATYKRAGGVAEAQIMKIIRERDIELLVAGLPLNEDGSLNEQCRKIEKFCRRLQKRIPITIEFVDEYSTSLEAEELIRRRPARGRSDSKGALGVDAVSAALILKRYIEGDGIGK